MIEIREAVPDDAGQVAELLYLSDLAVASVSIYDFLFPGTADERLEKIRWLLLNAERTPSYISRVRVAEIDGEVAGAICTFSREDDKVLIWLQAFREMGYSYRDLLRMLWRIKPYAGVNIHFSKGSLVIGNVATFPEFRRKGVAASLIDDAIETGRREGYREVQLTVLIGNDAARSVYERAGFEAAGEKRSRAFERALGFPGYARMSLEL